MPKYVNNRTGVNGVRGGVSQREVRTDGGEDDKLYYQERVAVIWIEKVKSVLLHRSSQRACFLLPVERVQPVPSFPHLSWGSSLFV